MKLRDFILDIKKIVDANPAALDLSVYVSDSRSGATDTNPSIFESEVSRYNYNMSDISEEEVGKPAIFISIG